MNRRRLIWIALGVVAIAGMVFLWHPVCVPIARAEQLMFTPVPIEKRTNERQWGIQTFQKRNDEWCQCKPWLMREMFF